MQIWAVEEESSGLVGCYATEEDAQARLEQLEDADDDGSFFYSISGPWGVWSGVQAPKARVRRQTPT